MFCVAVAKGKRKRGWIVWWMHSASEIKIPIKYLDLGKTKVIWDINWAVFMINKKVLMLPSTSRWQQYHSLHKYSPVDCAFVIGGQRRMEVLLWNRQLEAKERKENKCSSSSKFSSRSSEYCYFVYNQTSIKKAYFFFQIGLHYFLGMERMNFASGLSKIFWPLRIYTESKRTHMMFAYNVEAITRLQYTCSLISIIVYSLA